jgi:hypothetical protein
MSKAIIYEHDGKAMKLSEWAKLLGINLCTLRTRINRNKTSIEEIFSRKVVVRKRVTIDLGMRQPHVNTETIECDLIIKPQICYWFGCHKELSLQEKLFGNTCINHQ